MTPPRRKPPRQLSTCDGKGWKERVFYIVFLFTKVHRSSSLTSIKAAGKMLVERLNVNPNTADKDSETHEDWSTEAVVKRLREHNDFNLNTPNKYGHGYPPGVAMRDMKA